MLSEEYFEGSFAPDPGNHIPVLGMEVLGELSIYVTFRTDQTTRPATSEMLGSVFGHFPLVIRCVLKKNVVERDSQYGFGFVHFLGTSKGLNQALNCIQVMDGAIVDGFLFNCDLSEKMYQTINKMKWTEASLPRRTDDGKSVIQSFHLEQHKIV